MAGGAAASIARGEDAVEGSMMPVVGPDGGDTAWMIVATSLVLFMTLPGLSLFYGGLVRSKNVLSVLVQCLAMAGVMSLLWVAYGYSLAFGDGGSLQAIIGSADKLFLQGVTPE